jgi:hypothetical protein
LHRFRQTPRNAIGKLRHHLQRAHIGIGIDEACNGGVQAMVCANFSWVK